MATLDSMIYDVVLQTIERVSELEALLDQTQPDRRSCHAFFEVARVEAEAVAEELDDEILAGDVVDLAGHAARVPSPA